MKMKATIALLGLAILSASCSKKKEIRVVSLGEKAEIGGFVYQAIDTRWPMTLGDRTPKERFFVIRISIRNSGGADATIPAFEVVDDADNSFPESPDGSGVEKWLGMSRKLANGASEQGDILFDVPPKHYRLRVADENDTNFMYVDIPLNLTTEDPSRTKSDTFAK